MTLPDVATLYDVIDVTWPAAEMQQVGPVLIRDGKGGGQRVSAATCDGPLTHTELADAETAMRNLGQDPLFMIRIGDDLLDAQLKTYGYAIKDPVTMYAAPTAAIAGERPPPVTSFTVWPPLAVQEEIWSAGGVNADRIAVMQRAQCPKTTLLGRINDRPAGTVYLGAAHDCAMIHALEVAAAHRRQGLARHLTVAAAFWAQDQGFANLTLLTTTANVAANALYTSLGMRVVGQYHYRIKSQE